MSNSNSVEEILARSKQLLGEKPTVAKDKFSFDPRPQQHILTKVKPNGFHNPNVKLSGIWPGISHQGFAQSYCVHNFQDIEFQPPISHYYIPSLNPGEELPGTLIWHSHRMDQYCPWRHGCHVKVSREFYEKNLNQIEWFHEIFGEFYEKVS